MTETVHLLAEDPELAEHLTGERRERAIEACVAPAVRFDVGEWSPQHQVTGTRPGLPLGLLVLGGLVIRRVGLGGRFGSELLGEGDLLRPWQGEDLGPLHIHAGRWRALREGRVAVLDASFAQCVASYPEVVSALLGRAVRRTRYLAVAMAIMHQPRIDMRLQMLLWELAVRWGHVHPDGVHLPVRLTHAVLGDLVAARRPTVTKALGELADRSSVVWTGQYWLLKGGPPGELREVGSVSIEKPASAGTRAA